MTKRSYPGNSIQSVYMAMEMSAFSPPFVQRSECRAQFKDFPTKIRACQQFLERCGEPDLIR